MNYKSFEDLPVWKASIEFALKVFEFTEKTEKHLRGLGDTKNQLERAAISISNNIAEGFERGTNTELIYFLYIARGSAGGRVRCFGWANDCRVSRRSNPIYLILKSAPKISRRSFSGGSNP
jgi:four helix bundle protein